MIADFPQRRFVLLGGASALLTAALPAFAQAPTGDGQVRIVVPYPPGGTVDVLARLLAEKMRPVLGTAVIVENKSGASGLIGAEAVARSAPDGRTLLLMTPLLIQAPHVLPRVPFDPLKDFEPVSSVARGSTVLVVPTSSTVSSVSDLVSMARANPGKVSIGNHGTGSSGHIQAAAMAMQGSIQVLHVPYRGSSALMPELLGGQVTAGITDITGAGPQVRAGKLRVLAIFGSRPSPVFPGVPTLSSLGYRWVDMDGWVALFAPTGVPAPVLNKLHLAVTHAISTGEVRERIETMGLRPDIATREAFAASVQQEAKAWGQIIAETKVRVE